MGIDLNKAKRPQTIEEAGSRTDRIRAALQSDIRNVVRYLFPKATFTANDARIGDVYGTKGNSLSIAIRPLDKAGMWIDHASSGETGDILTLWQAAQNISTFADTLNEADAWLNGSVTPRGDKQRRKTDKLKAEPDSKTKKVQTDEYLYTDIHGNKVCSVYKYLLFNADTGEPLIGKDGKQEKSFLIYRHSDKKWTAPNPRPVYRAQSIYQFTDVVIVEGEKCADALASIGIEATTASGGSNTKLEHTDWSPLAGKRVFLWPDNDSPGREYMERLGDHLEGMGCTVFHVPLPDDISDKWDAADAVEEGRDIPSILKAAINQPTDSMIGYSHEHWDEVNYEYQGEVLEDILPRVGLATLFGPSTGGKTFIVLDLMYRIARGDSIFDRETEACGIAYCAFEGHEGVRKRVTGIKMHRKISGIDVELIDAPWLLHEARDWKAFVETLEGIRDGMEARGQRLGIVVIDTLTSATAGSDTNSQADVTAAMKKLKRLAADMDLLILNVGHTGKTNGNGMVGSFAYKSEADAFLECRIEQDEEGHILRRSLYIDKSKDGLSNYVVSDYNLEVVSIGKKPNGKDITTCLIRWMPVQEKAESVSESKRVMDYAIRVRMILKKGEKLAGEIEKELTLSRSRVSEILSYMEKSGQVYSKTNGVRKIWYLSERVENEETE